MSHLPFSWSGCPGSLGFTSCDCSSLVSVIRRCGMFPFNTTPCVVHCTVMTHNHSLLLGPKLAATLLGCTHGLGLQQANSLPYVAH
ncbi:hypothetical protein SLEP1_g24106 [Rubroshorea leprosula]|uniref:Uncharacterized protein n=1 Tax=Rubroshorea leprosula TaxID=152421 RepID=A0AAV5JEI5_9ROSI|nr:hypothetical protein SLEP1_g24106 [Rubroshorea leprosula]